MKVAKVVTTCFTPRVVRLETLLAGFPLGYFQHSQNFQSKESVIDLLELVLELERKCDPGLPVDLIIVNNEVLFTEGDKYLKSIDGTELKNGKVIILNNSNYGRSFGGYNKAYSVYNNYYDYYIFTEDDILISTDGYASIAVKHFEKIKNCGFVAFQGITYSAFKLPIKDVISAHGGVGLTSSKVLKDVVLNYGALPHSDKNKSQDYIDIILNGEIAFTNKIYKLGYKLTSIPAEIKLYDFAYDYMRGIKVQRYAPIKITIIILLKKFFYQFKIIRRFHKKYIK